MKTTKLTIASVKAQLKIVGVRFAKTEYGEYRIGNNERQAYYTDDLVDALQTGLRMAKQ